MSVTVKDSVFLGKLPREQREAILRLIESPTFASAPRLRSVLVYLMQELEEGTGDSVNEQSIGQAVFGRPAGYNASEDNIVRVTIRHLRTRLEAYYSEEGAAEPLALIIPKGKYIPLFVPRKHIDDSAPAQTPLSVAASEVAESATDPTPIEPPTFQPAKQIGNLWIWLAIAVALGAGFLAGYRLRGTHRHAASPGGILSQLFAQDDNVSVVVVDTNLQVYRTVFGRQVSLDDYIQRNYANKPVDSPDPRMANAQRFSQGASETNVSSTIVAADIKEALNDRRLTIKHPHDLSLRDFQGPGNIILLGGPWINPWGQLFESRFNFRLLPETESPSSSEIHNLHPKAGEEAVYSPHMDGNLRVNYARIAIVSNLDNTGYVVLLGATSPESLEASGAYLLSPQSSQELLQWFPGKTAKSMPAMEILLEVKGLNGIPESSKVIAIRTVH